MKRSIRSGRINNSGERRWSQLDCAFDSGRGARSIRRQRYNRLLLDVRIVFRRRICRLRCLLYFFRLPFHFLFLVAYCTRRCFSFLWVWLCWGFLAAKAFGKLSFAVCVRFLNFLFDLAQFFFSFRYFFSKSFRFGLVCD